MQKAIAPTFHPQRMVLSSLQTKGVKGGRSVIPVTRNDFQRIITSPVFAPFAGPENDVKARSSGSRPYERKADPTRHVP